MGQPVVINTREAFVGFPPDAEEEKKRFIKILWDEMAEAFSQPQDRDRKVERYDKKAIQPQVSEITRQIVADYNYIIEQGQYTHIDPMVAVELLRESLSLQSE